MASARDHSDQLFKKAVPDIVPTFNSNVFDLPVPDLVMGSAAKEVLIIENIIPSVVKYFKYQICICLYVSIGQLGIPYLVCQDIERKIIDRIIDMESCSQAVELIINHFILNFEKKQSDSSLKVQTLLLEVKFFSDAFINHTKSKLELGPFYNSLLDKYYSDTLPIQLNILFRIALSGSYNYNVIIIGIKKGLKWISGIMQRKEEPWKSFLEEIVASLSKENPVTFEKFINSSKSIFLNNVISHPLSSTLKINCQLHGTSNITDIYLQNSVRDYCEQKNSPIYLGQPFEMFPVPALVIEPSIFDNVPFMDQRFPLVLKFFKYQMSLCVYLRLHQMKLPLELCKEIESKIIDGVTNIANCSTAVKLIFKYFSMYLEKRQSTAKDDVFKLLKEVQEYSDSFAQYIKKRFHLGTSTRPNHDEYYTSTLPTKLIMLFLVVLKSDNDRQGKLSGITKGLNWLSGVLENEDESAKAFIQEINESFLNNDSVEVDKAIITSKSTFLNMLFSQTNLNPDSDYEKSIK